MTDDRQRYKHSWRCRSCGDRFHTIRLTADAEGMNPRCPKNACKGKSKPSFQEDVGMDVAAGRAPGVVGANVQVKAYDSSMEIAMQDHGMTDIQDHRYQGESTAPKLPTHLQQQADAFWGSSQKKQKARTGNVDLSPIFGSRATPATTGAQFKADSGSLIAPILQHKPQGSSPIPPHTVIAG